ncbi:hypothetical protein KDW61_05405 [Burkholderia cenocepacia]|uniref:hypothetical protein n=1 Tax=Burkholderia cenocepacia TaxID=95486 RepID=UPI001BA3FE8F|nr:hypothetical protein [Burkholderia cenocepacia]MBR8208095.1 hypothetical protein [Burkholderia cenocepacia]
MRAMQGEQAIECDGHVAGVCIVPVVEHGTVGTHEMEDAVACAVHVEQPAIVVMAAAGRAAAYDR